MDLRDNIAPCFYEIHRDIRDGGHTEYWLKGGRGSTKSSFVSIEIILGMMKRRAGQCGCIPQGKRHVPRVGIRAAFVGGGYTGRCGLLEGDCKPYGDNVSADGAEDNISRAGQC